MYCIPLISLISLIQDSIKEAMCVANKAENQIKDFVSDVSFKIKSTKYFQWNQLHSIKNIVYHLFLINCLKITLICADWCGSVDWVPICGKVAGSIPSQGTCLGFGPGPQLGAWEIQPIAISLTHHVSLPLFLPPLPSL